MTISDKIYRIASFCVFILHILIFTFVTIVGFLPFKQGLNFYECFIGFFGRHLSTIHPYFIMAILFLSCVMAFFAIKRPHFSIFVLVCSFSFFFIAAFPYCFDAMIVGFVSPWLRASMPAYKIGFELINAVSYSIYLDGAFLIFAVVILIVKAGNNGK